MELIDKIKKELKENLSEKRYIHSIGTMERAEELAKIYGVDLEKANLAGLTHDIAKEMTKEESLEYIRKHNIEIDEIEKINVKLLHGKIGANMVKEKYGLCSEIQNAILYHTTTDKNMDMLAKIIYVADKTEKNRKSKEFDIEYERELANKDIDAAIIYILDGNITEIIKKGKLVHPKAIETRNSLLIKGGNIGMKNKGEKGVTLIALVITIVVLLILAGISLRFSLSDNSLIKRAQNTTNEYQEQTEGIASHINNIDDWIDENGGEDGRKILPSNKETLPYYPSNKFDKVTGSDLDNGLVIEDKHGNQFVWVEVPKNTNVYKKSGLNITDFTTSELNNIKADLIAYAQDYRADGFDDTWYEGCGISSSTEYTTLYNTMLKSVYQNGGFWVARYELGIEEGTARYFTDTEVEHSTNGQTPVIKANKIPYTWIRCSQAQTLAKSFTTGSHQSSLLFGIQWDLICKHLEVKAKNPGSSATSIKNAVKSNSTDWGNYCDATFTVTNTNAKYSVDKGATWKNVLASGYTKSLIDVSEEKGVFLTTGANTRNSLMNIYDLAGNAFELTLEKNPESGKPETVRGGGNEHSGATYPVVYRGFGRIVYSDEDRTARVTIF